MKGHYAKQKEAYEIQEDVMEINGKMVLTKSLKILDISIGGVCLQIEKRLNFVSQYTLRIEGNGLEIKGKV